MGLSVFIVREKDNLNRWSIFNARSDKLEIKCLCHQWER